MNEVMTRGNTAVANAPERNAFEQYSEAVNRNSIVGDLLKFSKGEYSSGQDDAEIPEGTQLVANMDELMIGWVKWQDGKPADMVMGRIADGYTPPKRPELGDTDKADWETDDRGEPRDPWQLTNYLILKDPKGDQLYTFATSSKGGLGAIGKLCGVYGKTMRSKPDVFPIIALNVDSYKHSNKAYGKIYVPQFDVEGWAPKASFAEALAAADEAAAKEKAAAEDEEQTEAKPAKKSGSKTETRF